MPSSNLNPSPEIRSSVLRLYARPIAHMWRQSQEGRLGLVLGAGVNKTIGFPTWRDLARRIAEHKDVEAEALWKEIKELSLPIVIQVLLQHFREKQRSQGLPEGARNEHDESRLIAAAFRDVMHECLYENVPGDDTELAKKDEFYSYYLDVVRRSSMTVVYNFDDTLERLLLMTRSEAEKRRGSRGFEVVTDGTQQFRRSQAVIYHPNGYLPFNLIEGRSDRVVFSEESFEDQLIQTVAGAYATLLHHLSKNTCLFVGLSLEDSTLRHILRQSAKLNPGNCHYFVSFVDEMPSELTETQRAYAAANLEVFNLVTVYLDAEGIQALGSLLSSDADTLLNTSQEQGIRLSYCYYLTGVPGVGKTTTFSYFRGLVTFDEWLDERLPEMGRPWTEVAPEDEKRIDDFVRDQWGRKNLALLNDVRKTGIGIILVDRAPPDAIAFTKKELWQDKATDLLRGIARGKAKHRIQAGHVILLLGDPPELVVRARSAGKDSNTEYVERLQTDTQAVYWGEGVTRMNARDMTVSEVVQTVTRIIHSGAYVECDLHGRVEELADKGYPVPAKD